MTELDEVAENMHPPLAAIATLDTLRVWVRAQMPGETSAVVDGVTESLWQRVAI